MRRNKYFLWKLAVISIMVYFLCISASAMEFHGVETIGTYDIPESFQIIVHPACSGHNFFYQVSPREDGSFLVLYRQSNDASSNTVFGKVYLDVFDTMGSFLYELSFDTSDMCSAEYSQEGIVLYFYDHIIIYNAETQEYQGYQTAPYAAQDSGIHDELSKKEVTCGEWKYTCTKTFADRTGLKRTNGVTTQTLLDLSGSGLTVWNSVIPAGLFAIIGIALSIIVWHVHRKKRNT